MKQNYKVKITIVNNSLTNIDIDYKIYCITDKINYFTGIN